jgi:hypothetical protein
LQLWLVLPACASEASLALVVRFVAWAFTSAPECDVLIFLGSLTASAADQFDKFGAWKLPVRTTRGTFSDDMPEFHRQMGCMAGIFQIFDRQRLITGRRAGRQAQKRLPPPPASGRDSWILLSASSLLSRVLFTFDLISHISSFS